MCSQLTEDSDARATAGVAQALSGQEHVAADKNEKFGAAALGGHLGAPEAAAEHCGEIRGAFREMNSNDG